MAMLNRNLAPLPIDNYEGPILEAVRKHRVVVLVADTGAGKSTRVSRFLLDAGHRVILTQPRRLAAQNVGQRIAYEYGEKLGRTIGVRTGLEDVTSSETRCLIATDELILRRTLGGYDRGKKRVVIIDEWHEQNLAQETLVAVCTRELERDPNLTLVIMSATIDAERISKHFHGAPTIDVPGRLFPIDTLTPGLDIVSDIQRMVNERRNTLVFLPGKSEINELTQELVDMGLRAVILPLHAELDREEQEKCFKEYDRPLVILSTNVAQTSITVPSITAVIDSGLERRVELVNGIESLVIAPISRADGTQRKGRAGRVKPGVYIDRCPVPWEERPLYPTPEIDRHPLNQTVLRLAASGLDAEQLRFVNQPNPAAIHEARRSLRVLECLDKDGNVTEKGHVAASLPVSVQSACLLIEANKRGVLKDAMRLVAIVETKGITLTYYDKDLQRLVMDWKKLCRDEQESDLLAQLAVYKAARDMNKSELKANGINVKNYFRARDAYKQIADALRDNRELKFRIETTGTRHDLLCAIYAAFVDHLYHREGFNNYRNGDERKRELRQESCFPLSRQPEWLVGQPLDLQVKNNDGELEWRYSVTFGTAVKLEDLVEVAPHLFEVTRGENPGFSLEQDVVLADEVIRFNGQEVERTRGPVPQHPDATRLFAERLAFELVA